MLKFSANVYVNILHFHENYICGPQSEPHPRGCGPLLKIFAPPCVSCTPPLPRPLPAKLLTQAYSYAAQLPNAKVYPYLCYLSPLMVNLWATFSRLNISLHSKWESQNTFQTKTYTLFWHLFFLFVVVVGAASYVIPLVCLLCRKKIYWTAFIVNLRNSSITNIPSLFFSILFVFIIG